MNLDKTTNYIVSGLERSGTSMLMQVLFAGGVPMAYDHDSRPPDENNPKGYYELEGGKVINSLMKRSFPLEEYKGQFIKITAYGLKYLPLGKYKIIYSERNIEEILDSMEKMASIEDKKRSETKQVFLKLNMMIKRLILERQDTDVIFVNYGQIVKNPEENIARIAGFLGVPDLNLSKMVSCIDEKLYRKRRESSAS